MAEGYFQHAEHYFRIINAINQAQQQNQPPASANGHTPQPVQPPQHNGPRRDEPEEQEDDEQPDLERELRGEQPELRTIPITVPSAEE